MSGTETIEVNGTPRPLEQVTVAELLESMGHGAAGSGIAVAVNGEVVRRALWSERRLRAGDRVDIVGAVQGG
ncbi:MAG TPA: sulfur carrier protein ThiS [Candidatus Polarisedimenticolaceae bacterium]|nr:sulfur carrier protein ThiS [Candidatus Polarisedimenticolaceae bacterium]